MRASFNSHFKFAVMSQTQTGYPDLHDHLESLKQRGLLQVIDRPIDKDSELHPLVRWQFVGGMDEANAKLSSLPTSSMRRVVATTSLWWSVPWLPTEKSTVWAWGLP